MLTVAEFLFVFGDLPLELVHAPIDARVRVGPALVGDKRVAMLSVNDHFHVAAVILSHVEDHFDLAYQIIVFLQLAGLVFRMGLEGRGHVHMSPDYRNCRLSLLSVEPTPFARMTRSSFPSRSLY